MPSNSAELQLADWRRRVNDLYSAIRADDDPRRAHLRWQAGRDELFQTHPQSPLTAEDPLRKTGLPYAPYDPELRFEVSLQQPDERTVLELPTGADATTALRLIGHVRLPAPVDAQLDVWWLDQYAGGVFVPLRDGTAGDSSYGGGRYALDTAKGADLGGAADRMIIDLNFLYHPSCRYNTSWQCPLAPAGNTIAFPVHAGEQL